jgi:LuxR family transcriptional regulator, maltose regulon positive regulatory protein
MSRVHRTQADRHRQTPGRPGRSDASPPADGARPRTAAAAPPFELLESKLGLPKLREELVCRTALVELLRSTDARIVSLVAPAGYGKTTLLTQWALHDARADAWVTIDRRDDDPVVLLTYIAAALDRVEAIEPSVYEAVAAAGPSIWTTALPRLGAALAATREPFVLVLDDVDELRDRDCLDALTVLAGHVPAGSQLVLSGRGEAQLRLPRLRVTGGLLEIGSTELALSDAEAHTLLTRAGVELTAAEAGELNVRAEGWAAGLYLAALSLGNSGDPARLTTFAGDDRLVIDYLRSEHLSGLSRKVVQFLTRTSVLEHMSAVLCDTVLERGDSAQALEALERANLFVVPLDTNRGWYRYHHLFREMLRTELERREPEQVAALQRRAAAWYAGNGHFDSAIDHASAAGDVDEVARLVGLASFPTFRSGRVATVERWLDAFDDAELLARYPAVATFGAYVHALRGRAHAAERWADALERSTYEGEMPDGSASIRPWVAMVRALLCRRGVDRMREDAEQAVAELAAGSPWRAPAAMVAGVAARLQGNLDQARALLGAAAGAAAESGARYAGVVAHAELALLALERGDVDEAERQVAAGGGFVEDRSFVDYAPSAILLAARARLEVRRGNTERARQNLVLAQRVRPQLTTALSWFSVQARLELARVHLALGDPAGARALHLEVRDVLRARPDLGTMATEAAVVGRQISAVADPSIGWASTLTAAELRLLPLLTTHLSFREIAERLFVSRNTVKTQAISIYRKLDASSRSEAIARAVELGLVDDGVSSRHTDFIPAG